MSETTADEHPIKFEVAKSGRSKCRATGELIEKGEHRTGLDVWTSGRMATAWMKPVPFLKDCCRVEYALNAGSQGSCRSTHAKFERGAPRFVATAGDPAKKAYFTLAAAGALLSPVVLHVGCEAFRPTQLAGLEALAAADRAAFYQAFEVPKAEAAEFDRQHPPPPPPSVEKKAAKSPGRGKEAKARAAAEEAEEAEAEAEAEAEVATAVAAEARRPAKRARGAASGVAAGSAAEPAEPAGSNENEGPAEDEGIQGLTEMERQRAQRMAANRERLMALNLPGMAADLMPSRAPHSKAPAAAKLKGVSSSRKRVSEVLPRRESSRLRGVAADGSSVHSERQGQVVVVAGEVIRTYASGTMTEEQEPQERHPQGELRFESDNGGPSTDEAFIQLLAASAASANSGASSPDPSIASPRGSKGGKRRAGGDGGGTAGGGSTAGGTAGGGGGRKPMGVADMARLKLEADDVAKVTKDATTHLAFHPTTDTLILACADKKGNLGLWHVNHDSYDLPASAQRVEPILRRPTKASAAAGAAEGEGEGAEEERGKGSGAMPLDTSAGAAPADAGVTASADAGVEGSAEPSGGSGEFDGVLLLQPQHYQYICGLKWAGGSGRGAALFTASYDGSLRRLDVEKGMSDLVVSSEEAEYSCMDVSSDGRTVLVGDNDGALALIDTRAPGPSSGGEGLTVHAKKINTVQLEPSQEQVFATSSTDTSIRLWDLRAWGKGAKPLATANHKNACQAAMWAPDGSRRLLTTSFDNTLRIWDGAQGGEMENLLTIRHDNNTGRWVLPFRAVWNAASDGVIVGNMKRFVDVFDAGSGDLRAQLHSDHMTAIASRNAVHPMLPVLASATNSGRVHIYRH